MCNQGYQLPLQVSYALAVGFLFGPNIVRDLVGMGPLLTMIPCKSMKRIKKGPGVSLPLAPRNPVNLPRI